MSCGLITVTLDGVLMGSVPLVWVHCRATSRLVWSGIMAHDSFGEFRKDV